MKGIFQFVNKYKAIVALSLVMAFFALIAMQPTIANAATQPVATNTVVQPAATNTTAQLTTTEQQKTWVIFYREYVNLGAKDITHEDWGYLYYTNAWGLRQVNTSYLGIIYCPAWGIPLPTWSEQYYYVVW